MTIVLVHAAVIGEDGAVPVNARSVIKRIRYRMKHRDFRRESPQTHWHRQWAVDDPNPHWRAQQFPAFLDDAITSGWIAPDASILDLGCGDGDVTAELAERVASVVGYDFAPAAIERAKAGHSGDNLSFAVRDVTTRWEDPQMFDAAFDRGCLHCLRPSEISQYVANVAASVKPGGQFVLFHRLRVNNETVTAQQLEDHLTQTMRGAFEIDLVQPLDIVSGEPDSSDPTIPALGLRLVRQA